VSPVPGLDQVSLNFSPTATLALQAILAIVVFGVSLELSFADFARLLRQPRALAAGLASQLVALPLLTFALIVIFRPQPSLALGMIMVASCPGGNVSNVLTHWSGGRTAVSMSLTALSGLISPLTTPLTFRLIGDLHPATRAVLRAIHVPYGELVLTIVLALVVPLLAAMTLAQRRPQLAARLRGPLRRLGLGIFLVFVVLALAANRDSLSLAFIPVFGLVLVHNALALATGFNLATIVGVDEAARRAITFETGIHNTALGLALVFTYFKGLGGMALVVAWWGVWHLLTGGLLARAWARRPVPITPGA
jgi:BASS family bile acid:Na+ symporter